MAEFPAIPLYTDALLADCGHLTDAEFGLYLRLLIQMWRSPDGFIPDDDAWLAKRFGKTPEQVQSELRPIIAEFAYSTGKRLSQRRLQRELSHAHEYRKRQSDNAKSRWNKKKTNNAMALPPHEPQAMPPMAMHPNPIRKNNSLGSALSQAKGQAEEGIRVSPALAAKYTKPRPDQPKAKPEEDDGLEIPEFLRRTA